MDDLIALVMAIDGILQQQASADANYFVKTSAQDLTPTETARVSAGLLDAYRWQYIVSGTQAPRFRQALVAMTTADELQRIHKALAPLMP